MCGASGGDGLGGGVGTDRPNWGRRVLLVGRGVVVFKNIVSNHERSESYKRYQPLCFVAF